MRRLRHWRVILRMADNSACSCISGGLRRIPGAVSIGEQNATILAQTAPKLDKTEAASLYQSKGGATEFSPLIAALQSGVRSVAWGIIGDSTGDSTDEWVHLTALWLAAQYPAMTVKHKIWNTATQDYDTPIVIQTGAAGARYANITGGPNGGGVAMADSATNSITGDIDIRALIAPNAWNSPAEQVIAAKFAGGGARSWRFMLNTGTPALEWSPDGGTTLIQKQANGWTLPAAGEIKWLRVTLDVDNGASGSDVKFYTSTDGTTWMQVGTTITTAGVTSVADTTAELQVAARGGFAGAANGMIGKVYEIQIRDGLSGPLVAPALVEHWPMRSTDTTYGGAQVFTIVNGSHPGADITYLKYTARLARMTPDYGQALVTLSCSHNDLGHEGEAYLADWSSIVTFVRAKFPPTGNSLTTQNPKIAPALYINEHAYRRTQLFGWASRNNVGVVDAFRRFQTDGRPMTDLVITDGIHPSTAGSVVWSDAVKAVLV